MQQENRQNIVAYFNDIASARSACVAGAGWALLPRYAVKEELKTKKLIEVIPAKKGASKYGVWWLRTRYQDKGNLHKLCDWVKAQEL